MKFRKKPIVIDAWVIDFDDTDLPDWVAAAMGDDENGVPPEARAGGIDWSSEGEGLYINTLEGVMTAEAGDILIRGVKGELYACKPDIFAMTYEPAE